MTALKKSEFTEVAEVSIFDGAHTGLISSTCIQLELPAFSTSEHGYFSDKSPKEENIFDGQATGLVSSTC